MSADPGPDGPSMDERFAERRAEVLAERRRRRRRWLGSLAAIVVIAALTFAVARSPLFAIAEVRVLGAVDAVEGDGADEVRSASGIVVGENLLAADVAGAEERVTALPWVAEAEVLRAPPATVEVRVVARERFAVVRLADESWVVDAEGVVLGGGAPEGLVVVDAPDAELPRPGGRVSDDAVEGALAFHARLPDELADDVVRYDARSATDLRLLVEDPRGERVRVRVGSADQAALKGEVIAALLRDAATVWGGEEPGVVELDVRAPENPVVIPPEGP